MRLGFLQACAESLDARKALFDDVEAEIDAAELQARIGDEIERIGAREFGPMLAQSIQRAEHHLESAIGFVLEHQSASDRERRRIDPREKAVLDRDFHQ